MSGRITRQKGIVQCAENSPSNIAVHYCQCRSDPKGYTKRWINDQIGYGVFTLLPLRKHQFILQYPGDIISRDKGERLEEQYPPSYGSFIFFFDKKCVDATNETRLGKFINHSGQKRYINCRPKLLEKHGHVYICFFASNDIPPGTELRYDYGIRGHEWQKDPRHSIPYNLNSLTHVLQAAKAKECVTDDMIEKLSDQATKSLFDTDVVPNLNEDSCLLTVTNVLTKLMDDVVKNTIVNDHQAAKAKECVTDDISEKLSDQATKSLFDTDVVSNLNEDSCLLTVTNVLTKLVDDVVKNTIVNDHQVETTIPVFSDSEREDSQSDEGERVHSILKDVRPSEEFVENSQESCLETYNLLKNVQSVSKYLSKESSKIFQAISTPQRDLTKSKMGTDAQCYSNTADLSIHEAVDFNISACSSVLEVAVENDSGLNLEADIECIDTDAEENVSVATEERQDTNKSNAKNKNCERSMESGSPSIPLKKAKKEEAPRPVRPCFICKKEIKNSKLNRHISRCHKEHPEVKAALLMHRRERLREFDKFRKLGIYSHNIKEIESGNDNFLSEKMRKSSDTTLVMCTSCKGFYSKSFKARHKAVCAKESCQFPVTIAIDCTLSESWAQTDEQFKQRILNVMRDDVVGTIAKSDPVILMIGSRLYGKLRRRLNKKLEVERSVRSDMRRLAHVYTRFKKRKAKLALNSADDKNNAGDLFLRENFEILKYAVESYTDSDYEVQKSGLKIALYYLLKDAAEKLIGHCLGKNNDEDAEKIKNFLALLKLRKDEIFSDATYDLNMRRNVKSKKPGQLPDENDIKLIRDYVIQKITQIVSDPFEIIDSHVYVELRDCSCTRLVLFNGRRGGEPSRLTITQWLEAENDEWLDKQRISKESNLGDGTKITFQSGKGVNHLVPVFIPKDTVAAMRLLADKEVRKNACVSDANPYIFPSTQSSENHCSGWHSLDAVCSKLPIINRGKISGTSNRHRLSTLIAGLGLSESDLNLAYDHFGHSEKINKTIYQAPAAHQQLLSTGKHLSILDNGGKEKLELLPAMNNGIGSAHVEANTSKAKKCQKTKLVEGKFQGAATQFKRVLRKRSARQISRCKQIREKSISESDEDSCFSPESESSEDSLKVGVKLDAMERKYFQWSPSQIEKLYRAFSQHIKDQKSGWPASAELQRFALAEKMSVETIRNKINNERVKLNKRIALKKKEMHVA